MFVEGILVEGIMLVDAGGVDVEEFWSQPTKTTEPSAQTSKNKSDVCFIDLTVTLISK